MKKFISNAVATVKTRLETTPRVLESIRNGATEAASKQEQSMDDALRNPPRLGMHPEYVAEGKKPSSYSAEKNASSNDAPLDSKFDQKEALYAETIENVRRMTREGFVGTVPLKNGDPRHADLEELDKEQRFIFVTQQDLDNTVRQAVAEAPYTMAQIARDFASGIGFLHVCTEALSIESNGSGPVDNNDGGKDPSKAVDNNDGEKTPSEAVDNNVDQEDPEYQEDPEDQEDQKDQKDQEDSESKHGHEEKKQELTADQEDQEDSESKHGHEEKKQEPAADQEDQEDSESKHGQEEKKQEPAADRVRRITQSKNISTEHYDRQNRVNKDLLSGNYRLTPHQDRRRG